MRGKMMFLGGLAVGFVLGTRAGREKYEEIVQTARKVREHPSVQEATGVVQSQASKLYAGGKDKLGQSRLGEKLSTGSGSLSDGSASGGSVNDRDLSGATTATVRDTGTSGTGTSY